MLTKLKLSLVGVALTLVAVFSVAGQGYSLGWHVVSGGGGTSTNGQYSLSGTIGQSDAGSAMSGGNYSLTGGFWSLVSVVQTPGAPHLSIARLGNLIVISWPTRTVNFVLQTNSSLANSASWGKSSYNVSTNNGVSSITVSGPVGNLFFRLKQQL